MYRHGFVPAQYVVDAVCEANTRHRNSTRRNYERMVYESIENNTNIDFGVMLDDEIRKIGGFNPFTDRDYRE